MAPLSDTLPDMTTEADRAPDLAAETERAITALDPPPQHAALVALARMYVIEIGDGGDSGALALFGPKLAAVMIRLGATARPRTSPADVPADSPPVEPAASARPAGSPVDEIRQRREHRAKRRTG